MQEGKYQHKDGIRCKTHTLNRRGAIALLGTFLPDEQVYEKWSYIGDQYTGRSMKPGCYQEKIQR